MKLLLDTQAFLWMCGDAKALSRAAAAAILSERNELLLSVASWWELAIKAALGKLTLRKDWTTALKAEMRYNGIAWLPIRPEHCERAAALPLHHRDPFDRLLVAQAQLERLGLLSSDDKLGEYDIRRIW